MQLNNIGSLHYANMFPPSLFINLEHEFNFLLLLCVCLFSWLAFEGQDFTGRMYALEVGSYPDLRAMGYDATSSSIQSLQTTGFVGVLILLIRYNTL